MTDKPSIADVLVDHFAETVARNPAGGIIAIQCRCNRVFVGSRAFAEHQRDELRERKAIDR